MHSLDTVGITVPPVAAEITMRHQPTAPAIHLMPIKPGIVGLATVRLTLAMAIAGTETRTLATVTADTPLDVAATAA